jgi:hypothetical protein
MPTVEKLTKWQRFGTVLSQLLNLVAFNGRVQWSVSARSHYQGRVLGDREWLKRKLLIDKWWFRLFRQKHHCQRAYFRLQLIAKEILEGGDDV